MNASVDGIHNDRYCATNESPHCPWFCQVHMRHHPVITMVDHCEEQATRVDVRIAE